MSINLPPEILQANAYLRGGQKQEAQAVLLGLVRRQPDSELAWLMLSRTMDDPGQQADCLRQAVRINPQNSEARRILETLRSAPAVSKTPPAQVGPTPAAAAWEIPAPAEASKAEAPPWEIPDQEEGPKDERPTWTPPPLPLFTPAERAAASQSDVVAPEAAIEPGSKPGPVMRPAAPASSKASPKTPRPRGPSKKRTGLLIAFGVGAAILVCIAGGLAISQIAPGLLASGQPAASAPALAQSPASATPIPTSTVRPLPPTWTPTLSPTPTATRTITPTPAPSLTPTYPAPPATAAALMGRIEQEVSDLRGLPIQSQPPRYVMSSSVVEQMLKRELEAGNKIEQLKDEARTLVAMGLIKPTYDLVRYAMTGLVDSIGGFYRPETKEIYILGLRFGGMEHIAYSHEFDHALVDQKYDLGLLQEGAQCGTNSDRCEAVRALIEGDATLLMMQWLKQYGSPQDYREILNYRPPFQGLPEQFPPDYISKAMGFPYESGLVFVNKLYEQGNWARVNELYANPPVSSEQILHPEKYLSGEAPVVLQDPSLELALGSPPWRRISNDVMGEWTTFLVLAYSADQPARRSSELAQRAVEGWGGDQMQVMYNDETDQWAMAAHWVWDTPKDAGEFQKASQDHLAAMLRGTQLDRPAGMCWQSNGQAACLYAKGNETLWLVTTDPAALDPMELLFSGLTTP